MTNYIKSEVYRNLRSKGNYMFLFGGMGFVILLNVSLGIYANGQANFPYGNTGFSFSSFFTSMLTPMIICLPMVSAIYGQEFKHHTLKNSISYGIPRNQIYFGKFLMELVISLINLIFISGAYIISAYIMLENSGIVYLNDLLRAIVACTPLFLVSMTVAHCLYFTFENETVVGVTWAVIIIIVPQLLSIAGRKIVVLEKIASLMPANIVTNIIYNQGKGHMIMYWSSQEGLIKCFIVGAIGTLIFYMLGLLLFKKREIK
ncbi:ABC transporter permease [[Clostridium] dakarense]|uniref:ABC transporter permease n=1 Tax=Faecalimicrobium dakarense TaxID=1301100 RepID=UPI0004B8AFCF|nr:ABC transporter permease subunit [[Clostridium] dakarense]